MATDSGPQVSRLRIRMREYEYTLSQMSDVFLDFQSLLVGGYWVQREFGDNRIPFDAFEGSLHSPGAAIADDAAILDAVDKSIYVDTISLHSPLLFDLLGVLGALSTTTGVIVRRCMEGAKLIVDGRNQVLLSNAETNTKLETQHNKLLEAKLEGMELARALRAAEATDRVEFSLQRRLRREPPSITD